MYRTTQIIIKPKKYKELCNYFHNLCENYTYLKNTANFHIRQHMTGLGKPESELFQTQIDSIELVKKYVPIMTQNSFDNYEKKKNKILNNSKLSDEEKESAISALKLPVTYQIPTADKWFLSYNILDGVLKLSKNENYYNLPAHINQNALKEVRRDWNSYFSLQKKWNKNPNSLTGKPNIPHYYKGLSTIALSNEVCNFIEIDGKTYLKFPKTDCKLNLGYTFSDADLVNVKVEPNCNGFTICITINVAEVPAVQESSEPKRVISIDTGKTNLMAVTNNIGLKPLLIRGEFICKKNIQWLMAIDSAKAELRKGLDPKDYTKPFTSKKIDRLYAKRNRFLRDCFYKVCHYIVRYCKENNIDAVIIGRNIGMKQNINLGSDNNRDFSYIPFTKLFRILKMLCIDNGICYIETEESYTSKASFFDRDEIPTYKKNDDTVYTFSGNRRTRDLYESSNGYVLNADINGSLNIMRKTCPELTECIKIKDVAKCDILNFSTFYPNYKPANTALAA